MDVLRNSIVQSIEKKLLLSALSHQGELRAAERASLHRISRACARDLRARLSTLLRQLRTARTLQRQQGQDATTAIAEMETTTNRMWAFLDVLPRYFEAPLELKKHLAKSGAVKEREDKPKPIPS